MKKDFIAISDYSPEDLKEMLDLAVDLKNEYFKKGNQPILKGKVLGMIFNKPSLRTRISFDMAMRHLGGRVMSGYVQGIMARVFSHSHVTELAKWSSVPVINGLSDYNHPCQAMADIMTIYENFDKLQGLKVVFIGDGNNVAVSLMHACSKLGLDFTIASPEGYDLDKNAWSMAEEFSRKSGSKLNKIRDPKQAVKGVDVIYTDTWTSMGQEEETEKRKNVFPPYQVNSKLVGLASKDVIVMHCLPAHRGQEITDEVADGPHSMLFPQAHNRLHAQKAILVKLLS
jgi:ornithine carbamoyltransferase